MTKRIISTTILLIVMLFTINVRANEKTIYDVSLDLVKGENSGELYNSMPTQVSRNGEVTVKIVLNNAKDFYLSDLTSVIRWDKSAFDIVETNGKYVIGVDDDTLVKASFYSFEDGKVAIDVDFDSSTAIDSDSKVLAELKFKVKNNVSNGIYNIIQGESTVFSIFNGTDYENLNNGFTTLKYQVGKTKLSSSYNKDSIANRSYVIGDHLFATVRPLRTEHIMLASKTINSDDVEEVSDKLDKMVIYFKDSGGDWVNAINNEPITPPDEFKISYVDLMETYLENGIYSNANNSTIVRLIQYSKEKAVITIEKSNERIHGIATMNGNVATLAVSGTTYNLTINDDSVALNGETLPKVSNNSVADYLNDKYGSTQGPAPVSQFINSEHSGKYVVGDSELYLLRQDESMAKVCIKTNNQTECAFDEPIYESNFPEADYQIGLEESLYGFKWTNDQIEVMCLIGTCDSSYIKTYTKEKAITAEDVFNVWEKNYHEFAVYFDKQNEEEVQALWVEKGKSIKTAEYWEYFYDDHYKEDSIFVNWRLNGNVFDPDMVINNSITLVAYYIQTPGKPTITIAPQGVGHDYYSYDSENDLFQYHLTMTVDGDYDGFDIFEVGGPDEPVASALLTNIASIEIAGDLHKSYIAKAFVIVDEVKRYGVPSDQIDFYTQKFAVSFNTNGGSAVDTQYVPYGGIATKPAQDPQKNHYVFDKWTYNNSEFDFTTQINNNIELLATWKNDFDEPVLGVLEQEDPYEYKIYLSNFNDYCTNDGGQCAMVSTDTYKITGYKLYEVTNEGNQFVGTFAPYEYATLTIEPNVTKTYVAIAFVTESSLTIDSEQSEELVINTNIPKPVIEFNPTFGTLDPTYDVENWIQVSNLSAYCLGTSCNDYKVDIFEVYTDTTSGNSNISFGTNGAGHVTATVGNPVNYYVRAVLSDSEGNNQLYSPYSEPLTLEYTIEAPVISLTNPYGNNRLPIATYNGENAYGFDLVANYSAYEVCDPLDPNNCTSKVDGYIIYEKNGETLTLVQDITDPDTVYVYVPMGSSKTFVAVAYKTYGDNQKVTSPESNQIVIDLTNQNYTFETITSLNDSSKVNVRGYLNNIYEVNIHGIKFNNVLYDSIGADDNEYVTIDASLIENVDSILLGIDMVNELDSNNFNASVSATRKTN